MMLNPSGEQILGLLVDFSDIKVPGDAILLIFKHNISKHLMVACAYQSILESIILIVKLYDSAIREFALLPAGDHKLHRVQMGLHVEG